MQSQLEVLPKLRSGVILGRGTFAILYGLFSLMWPIVSTVTMLWFFVVYAIIDAVFADHSLLRGAVAHRLIQAMRFESGVGVVAVILAIVVPSPSVTFMNLLVAFWFLLTGFFRLVIASGLRREPHELVLSRGWFFASAILSTLCGIVILFKPNFDPHVLFFGFGVYAVLFGFMQIVSGMQVGAALRSEGSPF